MSESQKNQFTAYGQFRKNYDDILDYEYFAGLGKEEKRKIIEEARIKYGVKKKSKLLAFILALFLGNFGLHEFYLGRKKYGIIFLSVTIVAYLISAFNSSLNGYKTLGYYSYLYVFERILMGPIRLITFGESIYFLCKNKNDFAFKFEFTEEQKRQILQEYRSKVEE